MRAHSASLPAKANTHGSPSTTKSRLKLWLLFASTLFSATQICAGDYERANQGQLSPELRQWSDDSIADHRMSSSTLKLIDKNGKPASNTRVNIRQVRHAFCFGSALNEWVIEGNPDFDAEDPVKFRNWFAERFNCGTPASTLHWKLMQTETGEDGVGAWYADGTIKWMEQHQMQILGHAVAWENPALVPDWVKTAEHTEAFKTLLTDRIERLVRRYDGQIKHWVGVNEMLDYDSLSTQFNNSEFTFRPWVYQKLKQLAPTAKLLTNEAGILAEPGKVEQYKQLLRDLIADGAEIDAIGIQAHFWPKDQEYIDFEAVKQRLDSLSELGLPIWITEFDYAHKDEHIRANQLEGFYRLLYAHPSVEAIKIWGYWEKAHWRADWGTPVALVEKDWHETEPGTRLTELLSSWKSHFTTTTDNDGVLSVQGFKGDYIAEVETAGITYQLPFQLGHTLEQTLTLQPPQ